jgi:CxxC motif-containing protein (DUF1111 family)
VRRAVAFCLLIAACTDDRISVTPGQMSDRERAECKMKGGAVWYSSLADEEYCKILATDLGKACSKRTDCQEECSADTRTCQSLPPMGFSVLDDDGQVVEGAVE